MTKKIILFIILIVCFLIALIVLAYVGTVEKQKQTESKQTELKQIGILKTEREINWDDITPEYFLTEDIFDSDAKTGLVEFNTPEDEEVGNMFVRRWYDGNDVPFIIITVMEYKDKIFDSEDDIQIEPGPASGTSEDTTMTYLEGFTFQGEIINKHKIETKQGQDIETTFHLDWFENRFNFSIEAISAEYQDKIEEIAKNIINKYSK